MGQAFIMYGLAAKAILLEKIPDHNRHQGLALHAVITYRTAEMSAARFQYLGIEPPKPEDYQMKTIKPYR